MAGEMETQDQPPRVFVDAICVGGCESVSVRSVPANGKDWGYGSTFHDDCPICGPEQPHNIKRFLSGLNRSRPDATRWDPEAGEPLETGGDDGGV